MVISSTSRGEECLGRTSQIDRSRGRLCRLLEIFYRRGNIIVCLLGGILPEGWNRESHLVKERSELLSTRRPVIRMSCPWGVVCPVPTRALCGLGEWARPGGHISDYTATSTKGILISVESHYSVNGR